MITSVDIRSAADALIAAKQNLDRDLTRMTEGQKRRQEAELSDTMIVMRKAVLVLKDLQEQIGTK